MSLVRISPTTSAILGLPEVKEYLQIDPEDTSRDSILPLLIDAAIEKIEALSGKCLINSTFKLYSDTWFPSDPNSAFVVPQIIYLPVHNVNSVTYVKYKNLSNELTTIDASYWEVDLYSATQSITPKTGKVFPDHYECRNAIEITFVAGYGPNPQAISSRIRLATLVLVKWMFDNPHLNCTSDILRQVSNMCGSEFVYDERVAPWVVAR